MIVARQLLSPALAALLLVAAATAPNAVADVPLGTVHGISYVKDQSAPVPSGVTSSSPAILARCSSGTELLGGGVGFNYGGTGAVLHSVYPTTTEGSEGSLGFDFSNNSGSSLVGTAIASCTGGNADPIYRGHNDELGSVGDILSLTAKCPNTRQVSGGGVFMNTAAYESNLSRSYPIDDGDADSDPDDGWKVRVWDRQGIGGSTTAYAICTDHPALSYRTKRLVLPVDKNDQPFVACRQDRPALGAGFWIAGFVDHSVLNGLEIYDGGDQDLAPDDGAQARVANILEEKRAKVFAICKR